MEEVPPTDQPLPKPSNSRPRHIINKKGTIGHWTSLNKTFPPVPGSSHLRKITSEELHRHNSPQDCWTVVHGIVYNITDYLYYHPGGADELLRGAGRDCSELYEENHSWVNERNYMSPVQVVGVLDDSVKGGGPLVHKKLDIVKQTRLQPGALPGGEFIPATISKIVTYNYNCKIFTFQLSKPITLEMGQHVKLIGGSGMPVIRPYTPLSQVGTHTSLDILVKLYDDGRMGRFLAKSPVGTEVKFKTTKNKFFLSNSTKRIGMIAGGTGIAPMFQVIQSLIVKSHVSIHLLFSNVVEEDILLREKLDSWATENPEKLKVHYTLTNPTEKWQGLVGRVDKEKVEKFLPPPEEGTRILVCGPIVMTNVMDLLLREMDYKEQTIFLFL